jgi:chromosomal replication initiator protein
MTIDKVIVDIEERKSIIKQEAERLGVEIPQESIEYIAKLFKLNRERLKSIAFGLCAFKTFTGYELKKYNSASVAMSVVTYNQPLHFIAQMVIDKVVKIYKITEEDLYSDKSTAVLVGARNIVTYILHNTFMASYRDIHKIIGRRSHTPVVFGNQDIKETLKEDINVRNIVEDISQEICNDLIDIQKDVRTAHKKMRERKKIEEAHERRRLLGW